MAKQVVGLFSNMQDAHNAVEELRSNGFSNDEISIVARNVSGDTTQTDGGGTRAEEDAAFGATSGTLMGGTAGVLAGLGAFAIPGIGPVLGTGTLLAALGLGAAGAGLGAITGGLVGALVGAGIPDEDANIYAEGVRRGGALVTVHAQSDDMASMAADIMDRYNVQDIDRLGQTYRETGWSRFDENATEYTSDDKGSGVGTGIGTLSGAATGAAIGSAGGPIGTVIGGVAGAITGAGIGAAGDRLGAEATDDDTMTTRTVGTTNYDTTNTTYSDQTRLGTTTDYSTTNREGEMTLPVVEEELRVGKREVESGGVRVTTNVTETPVNEQVTLRQEEVHVDRRPVDRPVDPNEINQLREGTFELRERSEEAVVSKEARVVEEVVISKETHQHTENIQDTVRRTDVDVEQIPGQTRTVGTQYTETTRTDANTGTSRTVGGTEHEGLIERGFSKAENSVERGTGLDLDRDGDVGQRDPRNNI